MKKFISCCCLALLTVPAASLAVEGEVDSLTLFTVYERSIPGFGDKVQFPAFEFFRTDIRQDNVFFNFYGWGGTNLRNFDDDDGHVETGYIGYRFPKGDATIKAGRFYQFAETGVEQVDGLFAKTDLAGGFSLSAYGGAPSRVDDDNKGDYILGGKLSWKYPKYLQIGVSALHEEGATTLKKAEPGGEIEGWEDKRQLLGMSLWLSPHKVVDLNANGSYNLVTEGLQEQRYLLTVRPSDKVVLSAEYKEADYDHYFSTTSFLEAGEGFGGPFELEGDQRSVGGSINLRPTKPLEITGIYRQITREEAGEDEDFDRYGIQTRLKVGKFTTGVHYLRQDADEDESSYDQVYLFGVYQMGKLTTNLNVLWDLYDEDIYNEDQAVEVGASASYKLTKDLSLTGRILYDKNPHYDESVSGYLWLSYNLKI